MKKILILTALLMFTLTSNATFHRKINAADLAVEKEGWQYERVVWPDGDVWVHCYPDYEICGTCPMIDPGGMADPTDETACNYLMGLAEADALLGNYTGSYYAAYQVSGEQNLRHYSVIMTYNSVTDEIDMAFSRID
jgi:hypothetical protein